MSRTSSARSATPSLPSTTLTPGPSGYGTPRPGWGGPWVPAKYQREGVKFLLKHPAAGLLFDPGLRKTSVTLEAFRLLRGSGAVHKALVIAPLRVAESVWSLDGEVGKWEQFCDLRVTLLHGPDKDERVAGDADLYVINPDGLAWLIQNKHLQALTRRGVDLLVIDELSAFKHTRSKRFKLLKPHLGRFRRRVGLTGSPASNGLLDLFGEAYCLDLGRALGPFLTAYRQTYFVPSGFGGYDWQPQVGAEDRIYAALTDLMMPARAADHLDLPPLVEQDLWVQLPKAAHRVYDELEEEFFTLIDDQAVTAANAAVASGKCRQVASGGLYADGQPDDPTNKRRVVKHLHDAKTEALVELVEELQGSPLLVFYDFQHDLTRIRAGLQAAFRLEVPAINGQSGSALETIRAWNAGELRVLAAHPAAAGHGLNLQESGSHVCWYTPTWDLDRYEQANRRLYRSGQKNRVVVHRLLARGTVDEAIVKAIASKRRGQDALFTALKDLRACTRRHRAR